MNIHIIMKTAMIGIVLAVWVSSAMCQSSVQDCLRIAIADPTLVSNNCASAALIVKQKIETEFEAPPEILDRLCSDECVRRVSHALNERCGIALMDLYCSRNDDGFCVTLESGIRIERLQNVNTACIGTNCSSPNCSAAVQNLSCCVRTLSDLVPQVNPDSEYFNIQNFLQAFECSDSDIPSGCSSRGITLFAIPVVILTAQITALTVIFL